MLETRVDVENETIEVIEIPTPPSSISASDMDQVISARLLDSDKTQLVDAPFSYEKKLEWRNYRKALRDISKDTGYPDVVLPDPPAET